MLWPHTLIISSQPTIALIGCLEVGLFHRLRARTPDADVHDQLPSSGGKRKNLLHEVVLASHVSLDQACAIENIGTISTLRS